MAEPYIGEIMMFAGNFAPRGWALCNGQLMNVSQYTALFAILGTVYGGDGRTTFGLPNLQGRVPVHAGQLTGQPQPYTLGQMAGQETVQLTVPQMPLHNHTAATNQVANVAGTLPTPGGNIPAKVPDAGGGDVSAYAPVSAATGNFGGNAVSGPAGGTAAHENRQPFCVVNFIIALEGIYPTRS